MVATWLLNLVGNIGGSSTQTIKNYLLNINMIDIIGCLTALLLSLLLSHVECIGIKEAKILTIIGWSVALFCVKGEFLPVIGPTLTYTKKAQKMTELANPAGLG